MKEIGSKIGEDNKQTDSGVPGFMGNLAGQG